MELKPGYKQTEVGVIPEEWEVATARVSSSQFSNWHQTQDNVEWHGVSVLRSVNQMVERCITSAIFRIDGEAVADCRSSWRWNRRHVFSLRRNEQVGSICIGRALQDAMYQWLTSSTSYTEFDLHFLFSDLLLHGSVCG